MSVDERFKSQLAADAGLKDVAMVPATQAIRFSSALDYVPLELTATLLRI
jgi:hypothetical protein